MTRSRDASLRALVMTVVHHPADARIRHREIDALLRAGWDVTYAAPFRAFDTQDPGHPGPGRLTTLDVPRATGRRRLHAFRSARRVLRDHAARHDLVLLHDPELLLAARGISTLPPAVWDVHEDTAAAVTLKPWLPRAARRPTASLVRIVEHAAERRHPLVLAEHAYSTRFARPHPVVPNTVPMPAATLPPDRPQAVYVGHLSLARGVAELVDVGRLLTARSGGRLSLVVVGHADARAAALLRAAEQAGHLRWRHFLPSSQAMAEVAGSFAGLSLLHDEANYRHSLPTKLVEYMGHGVPVVTTPLPLAKDLVEESGGGVVVPFEDPPAVVDVLLRLWEDEGLRHRMGRAGREHVASRYDWTRQAETFVEAMRSFATRPHE